MHFGGLRPSKPLTAGAGAGPGGIRHLLPQAAFLASEGRSKRLRATCRASPAPMARAVGAGTRLPRWERAHAAAPLPAGTTSKARRHPPPPAPSRVSCVGRTLETLARSMPGQPRPHGASGRRGDAPAAVGAGARGGSLAGWDNKQGPAICAAACHEPRFLLPSVARNAHSSASRPHPFAAKTAHAIASVGTGGKRVPCGHLPPKVAKRPEGGERNERRARPAPAATIERPGWVWDPPVSERRPSPYRAQHEPRPLQGRGTCEPTRKEGSHQPCSD